MILGSDHVYDALVARFVPRPIRSEADHEQALVVLDVLLAQPALNASEADYVELLSRLVADYEASAHPIDDVSGVALLKVLMEEHGLRQKDLIDVFKTESIVSEVLAGKRELNKKQIEGLAATFAVSPAVFFGVG